MKKYKEKDKPKPFTDHSNLLGVVNIYNRSFKKIYFSSLFYSLRYFCLK